MIVMPEDKSNVRLFFETHKNAPLKYRKIIQLIADMFVHFTQLWKWKNNTLTHENVWNSINISGRNERKEICVMKIINFSVTTVANWMVYFYYMKTRCYKLKLFIFNAFSELNMKQTVRHEEEGEKENCCEGSKTLLFSHKYFSISILWRVESHFIIMLMLLFLACLLLAGIRKMKIKMKKYFSPAFFSFLYFFTLIDIHLMSSEFWVCFWINRRWDCWCWLKTFSNDFADLFLS
jgi:hypothetical protein